MKYYTNVSYANDFVLPKDQDGKENSVYTISL